MDKLEYSLISKLANLGVVAASKLWADGEQRQVIKQIKGEPLRTDFMQQLGSALRERVAEVGDLRQDSGRNTSLLLHGLEPSKFSLVEKFLLTETEKQPVVTKQSRVGRKNRGYWKKELAAQTQAGKSLKIRCGCELVEFGVECSEFQFADRSRQRLLQIQAAKRLQSRGHSHLKFRGR